LAEHRALLFLPGEAVIAGGLNDAGLNEWSNPPPGARLLKKR
jgi:hypothetical protein